MNNNYNSIFNKLINRSFNLLNEAVLSKDQILVKANELKIKFNIPNDMFNQLLFNNESTDYINLLKDIYNLDIVKNNIEKEKTNKTKNIIRTKLEELLYFNFDEKDINSIDNELLKHKLDKKIYKIWLLILLKNKTPYLIEDLDMICSNLVIYDKYKNELNVDLFDKNSLNLIIKNKQDLSQLVEKYKDNVYNNPLSNIYINKSEAILLYEDNDIKVIIPKTHEASRYYGANSEWCTAYESPKNYDKYTSEGDLYIIIFKNKFINKTLKNGEKIKINNKWQFHFEDEMFMNINDNKLTKDKLKIFFNKYYNPFINLKTITTILKYLEEDKIDKNFIEKYYNILINKNNFIEKLPYFINKIDKNILTNITIELVNSGFISRGDDLNKIFKIFGNDKNFVLRYISEVNRDNNQRTLFNTREYFSDDLDVILTAISKNGSNYDNLKNELRKQKDITIAAISDSFIFTIPYTLFNDKEIVLFLISEIISDDNEAKWEFYNKYYKDFIAEFFLKDEDVLALMNNKEKAKEYFNKHKVFYKYNFESNKVYKIKDSNKLNENNQIIKQYIRNKVKKILNSL